MTGIGTPMLELTDAVRRRREGRLDRVDLPLNARVATAPDPLLRELAGVSLQGKLDATGFARDVAVAAAQRAARAAGRAGAP